MKKKYIFIAVILVIIAGGIGYYFYNNSKNETAKNNTNNLTYSGTKIGTTENIPNQNNTSSATSENNDQNTSPNNTIGNQNDSTNSSSQNTKPSEPKSSPTEATETEIASFSTKIYTKDSERQNNISITCSSLNDTIVENGKTFSFCNTVGKATSSKGYQKADVYKDGEVVQALGGGNCQVSTTLYNAALKISGINVTERHSHSNSVPYIKEGKDAAVAYGSYDFKFINNTGNSIKIKTSTDGKYVYAKILKIG